MVHFYGAASLKTKRSNFRKIGIFSTKKNELLKNFTSLCFQCCRTVKLIEKNYPASQFRCEISRRIRICTFKKSSFWEKSGKLRISRKRNFLLMNFPTNYAVFRIFLKPKLFLECRFGFYGKFYIDNDCLDHFFNQIYGPATLKIKRSNFSKNLRIFQKKSELLNNFTSLCF